MADYRFDHVVRNGARVQRRTIITMLAAALGGVLLQGTSSEGEARGKQNRPIKDLRGAGSGEPCTATKYSDSCTLITCGQQTTLICDGSN